MMRRSLLASLAIGVLGGGGYWLWSSGRLERPLEAQSLATRMSELAVQGDSVALGRLARRQCGRLAAADAQRCYEDYFVELSSNERVRLALGALTVLAGLDKSIATDGHVYTHVIGIRAFAPGQDVARIFQSCTGLFQSGCYHGVIQAFFTSDAGVDSSKVASLCDLVDGGRGDRWLRFQCVHGIGHGLEMIWNWELPRALEGCDWLVDAWDRQACYGGAFMENAVASMPGGHHTPARVIAEGEEEAASGGGDADEHAGHDMGEAPAASGAHGGHHIDPSAITFKMRDSADALYPCSIVAERYQGQCYLLQGGLMLHRHNMDYARAAEECSRAPEHWRTNCYISLGTNASGNSGRNARRSIAQCSEGDPRYQPWCFVGVVKNFIDVTADPQDGIDFCARLPEGPNRTQCWVAVGEQITVLTRSLEEREAWCARVPANGLDACRYGASLRPPPEGLPLIPDHSQSSGS